MLQCVVNTRIAQSVTERKAPEAAPRCRHQLYRRLRVGLRGLYWFLFTRTVAHGSPLIGADPLRLAGVVGRRPAGRSHHNTTGRLSLRISDHQVSRGS